MVNMVERDAPVAIARRQFREVATGDAVEITLYQPTRDPESDGDWICALTVVRNGAPLPAQSGHGVDSLQALINGIDALRSSMKEISGTLTLFGEPGEVDLPLIVQGSSDFLSLVESLLEAEYSRQLIFRKALHRAKEKKK